ncbi:MAG: hypothetical protein ABSE71_01965 [Candidatus Micrarchaeaceae archaeon]|jgi:hypothetical protein|nr:hypothetical protein [Candidatus Micrarchaeota archaeon]HII09820.1 hypothetical protein [Candidatus Micrarchaeota archaeon]
MNKLRTANSEAISLANSMGIKLEQDSKGNVFLGKEEFIIRGPENVTMVLQSMLRPTKVRHGRPVANQLR